MNIPYVMKKCTKCGRWLVASKVNFYMSKDGKYGLRSYCKECHAEHCKQYHEANKEKIAKRSKQWREANREKIVEQKKQYYEENKEKMNERRKQYYKINKEREADKMKQWYEANKEKVAEYHKQYREANKEKEAKRRKQWYENNKEKMVEWGKQYREANKERITEYKKQYYQTPQGQISRFNCNSKRRKKEEQQGIGITKDQWLELMSFFDWKCAYSGEYIGGKQNYQRTIDHIVPLNSGGDNMIWNCVPMTRSLNSSKCDKDMEKWYREQSFYDPSRLQKIYEWQEYAFNKWGKDTEYFNSGDIQIKLI